MYLFTCTIRKDHFKITPEKLEAAITERTRLFVFSSSLISCWRRTLSKKEELRALADVFVKISRYRHYQR